MTSAKFEYPSPLGDLMPVIIAELAKYNDKFPGRSVKGTYYGNLDNGLGKVHIDSISVGGCELGRICHSVSVDELKANGLEQLFEEIENDHGAMLELIGNLKTPLLLEYSPSHHHPEYVYFARLQKVPKIESDVNYAHAKDINKNTKLQKIKSDFEKVYSGFRVDLSFEHTLYLRCYISEPEKVDSTELGGLLEKFNELDYHVTNDDIVKEEQPPSLMERILGYFTIASQ